MHKTYEQVRTTGVRPADLKAEIAQLEQERSQLNNKIMKMKRDVDVDEDKFKEMLKVRDYFAFLPSHPHTQPNSSLTSILIHTFMYIFNLHSYLISPLPLGHLIAAQGARERGSDP
ncbi:hypothetical protein EON65_54065 [archaeon]|nr:MAG: hypothetical protein EON65_54065 [archaeon]